MCLHGPTLPAIPPFFGNLDYNFNPDDWTIKASELLTVDEISVSLFTLILREEPKFNKFWRLLLDSRASDPNSGIYGVEDGLLRRQHSSTYGLKQNVIPHSLHCRLSTMAS